MLSLLGISHKDDLPRPKPLLFPIGTCVQGQSPLSTAAPTPCSHTGQKSAAQPTCQGAQRGEEANAGDSGSGVHFQCPQGERGGACNGRRGAHTPPQGGADCQGSSERFQLSQRAPEMVRATATPPSSPQEGEKGGGGSTASNKRSGIKPVRNLT